MFTPTIYLSPENYKSMKGEKRSFIFIYQSAQKYTVSKRKFYDRVDDADVKVTATAQTCNDVY